MAIDPSISLGVRPPVIAPLQIQSPLEQFGKVLTLRNLMQEQQSGQLGLQANQLKLQQEQRGVADEQSLRDLLAQNPNAGAAQVIGAAGPVRGTAWLKAQADAEKARLDRLTQVNTLNVSNAKRRAQIAAGVTNLEEAKKAAWQGANEGLYDIDPAKNAQAARDVLEHLQTNGFIPEEWKQHAQESLDYAGRQELQNKADDEKRKADEAAAKLPGLKADTAQKVRADNATILAGALAQGPQAYTDALAKMKPEDAAPFAAAKTVPELLAIGSTPHERITAQQAADTATATAKQHAQQNAFEAARLGIERTKSAREDNIYQQTYGAGANPALVGVDPKLRTQVTKEAQKMGDEFLKAQANADQFQSVLDLARSGNKAAGSNLPLIGVETLNAINGIKRINKDEIKQYGGAGSLYDKIVGKIGGLAVGQPIPADVLKDIETMHNTLRQNSETEFATRRKGLNDTYKSNFPTDIPHTAAKGANAVPDAVKSVLKGAGPGTHTLSDGTKWMIAADGTVSKQ